jgi:hypothetical protein
LPRWFDQTNHDQKATRLSGFLFSAPIQLDFRYITSMPANYQAVISSVPWTDTPSPIMAPAVLKSCLDRAGIPTLAMDLNAEIYHRLKTDPARDSIMKFFLTEQVDRSQKRVILEVIDSMACRLLDSGAKWICLSLLTYLSQIPTRWLCYRLKQTRPDVRIVIGGPGAFISLKSMDNYAGTMLSQGLIDYYVSGDGEVSLPALISGDIDYPGVNSLNWQQLEDLDALPFPNFDDYPWPLYDMKKISVIGSRGCVRKCTFCDIHEHWTRYQWRSGARIFEEIRSQKERYGIQIFWFADSLVNGNQREYRELISRLAHYNQGRQEQDRIRWMGMFIIRPQDQMKEQEWALTAASGATLLNVGVESFVEHIRYHIGKKFTNDDLDFALRMGQKYGIHMSLLMIVGYVTETQADFEQQLQWVRDNRHYAAGSPIEIVQIGSGLSILPGTWLDKNYQQFNIQKSESAVCQDWTRDEIGSTPLIRMQWHSEMQRVLTEQGFAVEYMLDNHTLIEKYINDKYQTG